MALKPGWLQRQIDHAVAPIHAAERLLGIRDYSAYKGDDDQHAKDIALVAKEYLRLMRSYQGFL